MQLVTILAYAPYGLGGAFFLQNVAPGSSIGAFTGDAWCGSLLTYSLSWCSSVVGLTFVHVRTFMATIAT
jgi:hypothetical protein